MNIQTFLSLTFLLLLPLATYSINPIDPGFYADPEASIFNNLYHIHPTYSAPFDSQTFFDAFTSPDLVNWTKHEKILTIANVSWATRAMWAPSVVQNGNKYYFFFGANDVYEGEVGGIGVAVGDSPVGPFTDHLGVPLIQDIVNGAQPIDQFVFRVRIYFQQVIISFTNSKSLFVNFVQDDSSLNWYMYYGGWGHCNVVRLNANFSGLLPFPDGTFYKEITPPEYVEVYCILYLHLYGTLPYFNIYLYC
jgi:hypothetical protein